MYWQQIGTPLRDRWVPQRIVNSFHPICEVCEIALDSGCNILVTMFIRALKINQI